MHAYSYKKTNMKIIYSEKNNGKNKESKIAKEERDLALSRIFTTKFMFFKTLKLMIIILRDV